MGGSVFCVQFQENELSELPTNNDFELSELEQNYDNYDQYNMRNDKHTKFSTF